MIGPCSIQFGFSNENVVCFCFRAGHDSFEDARASLELVLCKVKAEVASTVKNSNAAAFPAAAPPPPPPHPPFSAGAAAAAGPPASLKLSAFIPKAGFEAATTAAAADQQQNNNQPKWFVDRTTSWNIDLK